MCTPSHCLPVVRTPFWDQMFSVGLCRFPQDRCQEPLIMVSFITPLAATGTSGQREPARPLGLLLLTLVNVTFTVKMFSSFLWQLHLGGCAGIFVEWWGTGRFRATAPCRSGRSQHKNLSLWTAPGGRMDRSCSKISLEQLLSSQEPSLSLAS